MYSKSSFIRVGCSIIILLIVLFFFNSQLSKLHICFTLFIFVSYNYSVLSLNKCPKCGGYMKKIYKKSFYLPDVEICEKDQIAREIKYLGENNV